MDREDEFEIIQMKMNEMQERIMNARFELDHAAKLMDQSQRQLERLIRNAGEATE